MESERWEKEMEAEHLGAAGMMDSKAIGILRFEMGKAEQTQEIPKRQRLGERHCW